MNDHEDMTMKRKAKAATSNVKARNIGLKVNTRRQCIM